MGQARKRLRRLGSDQAGAMAVMLALSLVPLSLAAISAIDLLRGLSARNQLQDALDAAALAAARSPTTDSAEIQRVAQEALKLNLGSLDGVSSSFSLTDKGVVIGNASTTAPTTLYKTFTGSPLMIDAHSEVTRAANKIEMALVLDVTGSMKDEIDELKEAATNLVNMVVRDGQTSSTEFYAKAALVPYSAAVNVGTYANMVRGELQTGTYEDKAGSPDYDRQDTGYTRFKFENSEHEMRTFDATTCVTERSGEGGTPTDIAPSVPSSPKYKIKNGVGRHYENKAKSRADRNGCLTSQIMPLTFNRKALTDQIKTFVPEGSTAGHIGLAWGWYTVSPKWNAIWKGDSTPKPYTEPHLIKVVVLMTDGEFNTVYSDGVISESSTSGSGDSEDHINESATNGSAFKQAEDLCREMKKGPNPIIIYTVGFALTNGAAKNLMNSCASKPEYVYLPNNGTDLKDAFSAIGQDINALRISK